MESDFVGAAGKIINILFMISKEFGNIKGRRARTGLETQGRL
jgi:hypothetical protein